MNGILILACIAWAALVAVTAAVWETAHSRIARMERDL